MVQRVIQELIDDLDGGQADETVVFGIDRGSFEIDLSEQNAKALREVLAPYIDKGRRAHVPVSGRRAGRAATGKAGDFDPAAVRAWAQSNGVPISTRGRISQEVLTQYRAAGN